MCAVWRVECLPVSDCIPTAGGPHRRDDQENIGRVLKGAEAKSGASERSSDQRELRRFNRPHIQGLFLQSMVVPLLSHNPSSPMVLENSAPQSSIKSIDVHISSRSFFNGLGPRYLQQTFNVCQQSVISLSVVIAGHPLATLREVIEHIPKTKYC